MNPWLVETWKAHTTKLRELLAAEAIEAAASMVRALRDDLWLSLNDSGFAAYAVAAMLRAGAGDEALAIVRDCKRFGFPQLWYFDHATMQKSGGPLYAELALIFADAAIADFMRANFSSTVTPWGFDIASTPLCSFETTEVTRASSKCALTGARLERGEEVYAYRYFNGAFDIPSTPWLALRKAFDANPSAVANRERYMNDAYDVSAFAFKVGYKHPLVNAVYHDLPAEPAAIITMAPAFPTPYRTGLILKPASVCAGSTAELVDLLWVLAKCGHDLTRVDGLELLAMLFDRPALRASIADKLRLPELAQIYALVSQRRLAVDDKAALAAFGRAHPAFQEQLAASLNRYEYHLYSNYSCSPNWLFQDFQWLTRGHGRNLVYLLASRPDLLPALADSINERAMIARPNTTTAGIAYDAIADTFAEIALATGHAIDDAPAVVVKAAGKLAAAL